VTGLFPTDGWNSSKDSGHTSLIRPRHVPKEEKEREEGEERRGEREGGERRRRRRRRRRRQL